MKGPSTTALPSSPPHIHVPLTLFGQVVLQFVDDGRVPDKAERVVVHPHLQTSTESRVKIR